MSKREVQEQREALAAYRCGACSGELKRLSGSTVEELELTGCPASLAISSKLGECCDCGGLHGFGFVSRAQSHHVVGTEFCEDRSEARYFDLSGIDQERRFRRHGFYNPETGRIVQVG